MSRQENSGVTLLTDAEVLVLGWLSGMWPYCWFARTDDKNLVRCHCCGELRDGTGSLQVGEDRLMVDVIQHGRSHIQKVGLTEERLVALESLAMLSGPEEAVAQILGPSPKKALR